MHDTRDERLAVIWIFTTSLQELSCAKWTTRILTQTMINIDL